MCRDEFAQLPFVLHHSFSVDIHTEYTSTESAHTCGLLWFAQRIQICVASYQHDVPSLPHRSLDRRPYAYAICSSFLINRVPRWIPDPRLFQGKVLDIPNLRGFICLPTQEAGYSFSGFILTNNQTNRTEPLHAGQSEERKKESEAELQ